MASTLSLTTSRRRALDRLLDTYLELSPDERSAFLAQCQRRYPRLSRWFLPLARESRTTTCLLTETPDSIAEQVLDRIDAPESPELEPGTRLGPWRIAEPVGAGGMGKVYRGERADGAFEMEVAIKLIASRRPALSEQLARESRLLARLDHPAITRLMDAGLTDEGEPYLVMEWVEGSNLDRWMAQSRPSVEQRLNVFREVAEAVSHAHQRLVVHGDIKPANIRIRNDGQVKLMDFGVAFLLSDAGTGEAPQLVAMTPAFAAPEQLAGESITTRSDIWSLGALLHAMLAGSPYGHERGTGARDRLDEVSRGDELRAIIQHACEARAEGRYASVQSLLDDVLRFTRDEPLLASPPGRLQRGRKFLRRNKLPLAALGALMAALTAGAAISTALYLEAESERQRAERHASELELVARFQEEQLAEIDTALMGVSLREGLFGKQREWLGGQGQSGEELERSLAELEETLSGINFSNLALGWLEDNVLTGTVSGIEAQFGDQPLVRARLLQSVANTMRNLAIYDRAWELQEQALDIYQEELSADHPRTLSSLSNAGRLLRSQGKLEAAEDYERRALRGRRRVLGDDHPDTLESVSNLGVLVRRQGRLAEAEPYYREALDGRLRALGDDDPDTLASMSNLGVLLVAMGRLDEAEDWMLRALDGRRAVLGNDDRSTLQSLNNMGVLLRNQERYAEAEEYYREALARSRRVRGDHHPSTLDIINNLGVVLDRQERLEEAAVYYRESLEGTRATLGDDHPATLASRYNMARVLREKGRIEEAQALGREVLDKARVLLPAGHWHMAVFQAGYGKTLSVMGRHADAEPYLLDAHETFIETLGAEHARTIELMEDMVEFYTAWHQEAPGDGHDRRRDAWRGRLDAMHDSGEHREGSSE